MNTTKRDVQDEKLYFIQSIDGSGQKAPQDSSCQNGDHYQQHTASTADEKEAVDIKDVELTLLPSYLHDQENVVDNTDLLQSISQPNPQLSPPKRPPRSNQSPDVPLERINVQVNNSSVEHSPNAGGGAQTL